MDALGGLLLVSYAMRLKNYSLIFLTAFLFACASSEETTQQPPKKEPEVYVFDDVNKVDTSKAKQPKKNEPIPEIKEEKVEKEPQPINKKFFVQVGAFTSKERAQSFIKENQAKIDYEMSISFRDQVQLYVVLLPPFVKREDAEKAKNSLRQITSFKDAFIITIE